VTCGVRSLAQCWGGSLGMAPSKRTSAVLGCSHCAACLHAGVLVTDFLLPDSWHFYSTRPAFSSVHGCTISLFIIFCRLLGLAFIWEAWTCRAPVWAWTYRVSPACPVVRIYQFSAHHSACILRITWVCSAQVTVVQIGSVMRIVTWQL
jgi:hypothetical protein